MAGNTDLIAKLKVQNQEAKKKLNETKDEVKALKAELSRLGKESRSSTSGGKQFKELDSILESVGVKAGKANGVLSVLGTGITKLSGFFGVAVGAGALFNEMLANSQTLGDAVERAQMQAGTAVDYFAKCMATADFTNFLNGIATAITQSGKLADMLDTIATQMQILGVAEAEYQRKRAPLINQYYDTSDIAERKKILDRIHKLDEEFAKRQEELASQQEKAAYQLALKGTGYDYNKINAAQKKWVDLYLHGTSAQLDRFEKGVDQEWETWQRMQRYRAQGSRTADGKYNSNYGMAMSYYSNHDNAYFEDLKFRKNLRDQQDDDDDAPLKQARTSLTQANHGYMSAEVNKTWAIRQQARLKKQEAAEAASAKRRAAIEAKYALKGADANGNLHYKADAETLLDMENNVTVLTQKLKKMKPETKEFEETYELITLWKQKIEDVEFGKPGSMKRLQNELKRAQEEVAQMVPNTEEYKRKLLEVEDITKAIADQELKDMQVLLKENAQTVDDINNNLKVYQALQNKCIRGSENWLFYQKKIKEETMKLVEWEEGSEGQIDHMIEELQKELQNKKLDVTARIAKVEQINKLQNQKVDMNNLGTVKAPKRDTSTQIKESDYNNLQGQAKELELKWKLGEIDTSTFRSQIKQIKAEGQQMFGKGFQVEVEMPMSDIEATLANASAKFDQFADNAASIANVYSAWDNFREVVDNGGNAVEQFMAIIQAVSATLQGLQTVMNLVNTITEAFATKQAAAATEQVASSGAVVAAKSGEAVAGATASGAKMPYPLNIIAIATGVAAVIAALAAISGAFAEGGIVGGSSSVGDHTLIRANKGEMVLNNRQQGNLFRLLDKGMPSYSAPAPTTTTFKLKGDSLVASLHNNNMSHSRTRGRRVSVI